MMSEVSEVIQLYLPFLVFLIIGIILLLNFSRTTKTAHLQKKILQIFENNHPHPVSEQQIILELSSPPHSHKTQKVKSVIKYLTNINKIQKTDESGKQINVYRLTK
jgi:hypothetical protein